MSAVLPFLNAILPTSLAVGGLSKLDPRMQKFLAYSAASGFSTDQALDYLRSRVQAPGEAVEMSRLAQGQREGSLRPDERAAFQRIEETNRVPSAVSKGLSVGTGLGAGLSTLGEDQTVQPQSASQDESVQGNPSYDPFSGLSKFPELLSFIREERSKGGNPESIASKARKSYKLKTFVDSIEHEIEEPFENLLGRLIGDQAEVQRSPNQDRLKRLAMAMQAYQNRKR